VKSRKQAIAIALSKARKKGRKVPRRTRGQNDTSTLSGLAARALILRRKETRPS
jgi:Family of unknown function (DUF6496)